MDNVIYGVITVSDSRFNKMISGEKVEDRSGDLLRRELKAKYYLLIPDNRDMLKGAVDHLIDSTDVECIVITGGTGVSPRDNTPDVLREMFHKELTGFSVLFHLLSYREVKYATILSRATAGIYRDRVIYSLPGSPNACKTALPIIKEETDHILKHLKGF